MARRQTGDALAGQAPEKPKRPKKGTATPIETETFPPKEDPQQKLAVPSSIETVETAIDLETSTPLPPARARCLEQLRLDHGVDDPASPSAVWWLLEDVLPDEHNPKNHPKRQVKDLAQSILDNGFTSVLLVHWPTGRVLAGHGRRLALLSIWKKDPVWQVSGSPGPGWVPIRFTDKPWDQAQAQLISDNALGEQGSWNPSKLTALIGGWNSEAGQGWSIGELQRRTGLGAETIQDAVDRHNKRKPAKLVPPPPPELGDGKPQSERGRIYRLGPHLLACVDCTNQSDLALVLGGMPGHYKRTIHATFMDPPYAIYGSSTGLGADIADDKLIRPFFREVLLRAKEATESWGHIYVCCDWRSHPAWHDSGGQVRLACKNLLVWDKGSPGLGSQYGNSYELIVYFVNEPSRTVMFAAPTNADRKLAMRSNVFKDYPGDTADLGKERLPLVVQDETAPDFLAGGGLAPIAVEGGVQYLRHNRVSGKERLHNAAKPVAMIQEIIEICTDPGQTVLDLFGGSGSTLMASARSGRVAVLTEIEPRWCDVIRKRWGAWAREAGVDPGEGAL